MAQLQPQTMSQSYTAQSVTIEQSANHHGPGLCYFISRADNILVPLIPADELPVNVQLQGVPRQLTFEQSRMLQYVGTVSSPGQSFKLQESPDSAQLSIRQAPMEVSSVRRQSSENKQRLAMDAVSNGRFADSNDEASPIQHTPSTSVSTASLPNLPLAPSRPVSCEAPVSIEAPTSRTRLISCDAPVSREHLGSRGTQASRESLLSRDTTVSSEAKGPSPDTKAVMNAIAKSDIGTEIAARVGYVPRATFPLPPSGERPRPENKEYCTYWIKTGYCDFMQQNCLYKHVIPDEATLRRIGISKTFLDAPYPLVKENRGNTKWWIPRGRVSPESTDDESRLALERRQSADTDTAHVDLINWKPLLPTSHGTMPTPTLQTPNDSTPLRLTNAPSTSSSLAAGQTDGNALQQKSTHTSTRHGHSHRRRASEAKGRANRVSCGGSAARVSPKTVRRERVEKTWQPAGLMASKHAPGGNNGGRQEATQSTALTLYRKPE